MKPTFDTSYIIVLLICALYNLSLLAGTVYLIVVYNWSEWTLLVTAYCLASPGHLYHKLRNESVDDGI